MPTIEQLRQIVPESVQRLNPHVFGVVQSEEPQPYKTLREDKEAAAQQAEAKLQAELEAWLVARGYGRRTPKRMQKHTQARWLVHLARPQGNPVLLDVLLLWHWPGEAAGHNEAMELELKVEGGSLSPDQKCLVLTGCGAVAWNLEQAKQAVLLWEEAVRRKHVRMS